MKQTILLMALLTITFSMHAQIYTSVNLGYKFPAGQQTVITNQTGSGVENVNWSFGGGFVPQIGIGSMVNDWLAIELDMAYLLSNNLRWTSADSQFTRSFHEHARGFLLSPKVVLNSPEIIPHIRAYSSVGLTFSPGSTIRQQEDATAINTVKVVVNEYKTRIALGYNAALGCQYKLTKKLDLFFAMEGMILAPALKSGKITQYTINGTDMLPTFDPAYTSWKFVDNKPYNSVTSDRLTAKRPFSSVGIVIGARYRG